MKYDAVIIGGGHNGLVCSAYLAKAGKKTLVLEKRDLLGGACVTEEVFPGCKVSRVSYVNSLFRPEIIRDLKLKDYGLEFIPRNPSSFSPFPDGRYLILGPDQEKNCAEIAKFSKKDAEAFPKYEAMLDEIVAFVDPTWNRKPPCPLSKNLGDLFAMGKMGMQVRKSGGRFVENVVDLFALSAADLLNRWFESEELKVTLATDGVIGAMAGPYSPGSAYILLHHVMGETDGARGVWAYVKGGMGALSEAIASSARDLGVEFRTGVSVEKILSSNGTCTGVRMEGGEEIEAGCVASSVDPRLTFEKFIEPEALPADFLQSIQRIDYTSATVKMNLHLSELPDFKALPGKTKGPQHTGTIHIAPTMDYVERAYDDAKYGRWSQHPMLECTIPSGLDETLTPDDTHVMGIFCQYAPYALKDGDWETERKLFAERIIDTMTEYAPNFRDSVLDYELLIPSDIERIFSLTGGNIFQGSMTLNQLMFMRPVVGWAEYKTPLANLFICGSAAHPGGGVTGAPGWNASRAILGKK